MKSLPGRDDHCHSNACFMEINYMSHVDITYSRSEGRYDSHANTELFQSWLEHFSMWAILLTLLFLRYPFDIQEWISVNGYSNDYESKSG